MSNWSFNLFFIYFLFHFHFLDMLMEAQEEGKEKGNLVEEREREKKPKL